MILKRQKRLKIQLVVVVVVVVTAMLLFDSATL